MQDRFSLQVINDDDFPEITMGLWEAFENPHQAILRLYFPIQNNDRDATLKANTREQLEEYHQQQPGVTWIKIVDTQANNKIAAAAKWYFYEDNPYAKREGPIIATWFPEGVARNFATEAVRQFEHPREQMAQRPHAFLHIAFVLPQYRRQGLSHLFLNWGVSRADSLGLESWLDASEFGAPVYEKHGFRNVYFNSVKPLPPPELTEEEQKEWSICEQTLSPLSGTVMWRPVGGKFIKGGTPIPWEQETTEEKYRNRLG